MTKRAAVEGAMSIAQDVTDGRIAPADLEAVLVAECSALLAETFDPEGPLWAVQTAIARGVLAQCGIPANELREWAAVAERRTAPAEPDADPAPAPDDSPAVEDSPDAAAPPLE